MTGCLRPVTSSRQVPVKLICTTVASYSSIITSISPFRRWLCRWNGPSKVPCQIEEKAECLNSPTVFEPISLDNSWLPWGTDAASNSCCKGGQISGSTTYRSGSDFLDRFSQCLRESVEEAGTSHGEIADDLEKLKLQELETIANQYFSTAFSKIWQGSPISK